MFIKWREENKPATAEWREANKHLIPAWANTSPSRRPTHRYYAYIATSERINGKPRQKIVTYLGSIPVHCVDDVESEEYQAFWYKVFCSLAKVRVSFHAYHDVMSELQKRVTRPSDEELMKIVTDGYSTHPQWHKDYEGLGSALDALLTKLQ